MLYCTRRLTVSDLSLVYSIFFPFVFLVGAYLLDLAYMSHTVHFSPLFIIFNWAKGGEDRTQVPLSPPLSVFG